MELYQLEYLVEVAKYENFTKAAQEVCVTPSSLSQQIKKLEEEIGVDLFERTTRSVHLTPAGKEVIKHAKIILEEISSINNDMQKYISGKCGHLVIAGTPALKDKNGITHRILQFRKYYPEVSFEIIETECFDQYPLLENKKIDVGFLTAFEYYNNNNCSIEEIPIVQDEIVLITNINHPLAEQKIVDLRDLKNEKFIMFSKSSGLTVQTINACHEAGFEPECIFETKYVDACLALVAEGMGIALISSQSVKNALLNNIAVLPLKQKIPRIMSMVYLKQKKYPAVLYNFINFIKQSSNLSNTNHIDNIDLI